MSELSANPYIAIPQKMRRLFLAIGAGYALFILAGTVAQTGEKGAVMMLVGLSDVFLIACLLYPLIFYKREYGYCHPLVFTSAFAFVSLVAKQTGGLIGGLSFHVLLTGIDPQDLQMLFAYGNFVKGIALLATYAGFELIRLRKPRDLKLVTKPHRYIAWVVLGVFAVAGIGLLIYARSYGGAATFLLSLAKSRGARASMRDTEDEGLGQYAVPVFATTVALLLWVCSNPGVVRDFRFVPLVLISGVMGFALGGKRSSLVYPAMIVATGWILVNRKVPIVRLALAGAVVFLIIGLVGIFRWSNEKRSEFSLDFLRDISFSTVATASKDEMNLRSGVMSTYYSILAEVPSKVSFRYGMTYLEYLVIPIPRSLWPGKPRGVDTQAGIAFAGSDWGMPPGAVGEAYWNFHLPGVVVVFFLFGMFLRWLGAFYERNRESPLITAFYALSVLTVAPTQNSIRGWVQSVVPLLLVGWAMGLMKPRKVAARARTMGPAIRVS